MNETNTNQDSFLMLILTELKSDIREVKADVKETRDKVSDLELHVSTALTENSIIAKQNESEIEELNGYVLTIDPIGFTPQNGLSFFVVGSTNSKLWSKTGFKLRGVAANSHTNIDFEGACFAYWNGGGWRIG